jgi:tetratricopeptide (TPR) repeat protein
MALRIEDVEPSDAFAYELSTRQWIDAFESWDKSLDSLARRIGEIHSDEGSAAAPAHGDAGGRRRVRGTMPGRTLAIAAIAALVLLAAAGAWLFLRPTHAAAHTMVVRLTGFQRLSPELPASMPDAMRDEVIAAFNDDGVIGVSTAAAPPPGDAPAYALSGTVRRDNDKIKVIAKLSNERTGTTLWSNAFSYDSDQATHVPRRIAVEAGNMVRCGLFAASTYPKALPDQVLTDYMQFCANSGEIAFEPGKALDSARKVVAAVPDFSWGWSAVELGYLLNRYAAPTDDRAEELRKQALEAADKAIALDPTNSEALTYKAVLQPITDWVAAEKLFKQALDARPLACGCEHHMYGQMLQGVGRSADAIEEFRRSTDVLALNSGSQFALAESLLAVGKTDEAKQHFDAAIDLDGDPTGADNVAAEMATLSGDYAAGIKALRNPKVEVPADIRAALLAGYEAKLSGDPAAKAAAIKTLMALPPARKGGLVVATLGALGANREVVETVAAVFGRKRQDAPSWLFIPVTRGALDDPGFPALAQKLGLMTYWKTTHTKPDVCSAAGPPAFCRMI